MGTPLRSWTLRSWTLRSWTLPAPRHWRSRVAVMHALVLVLVLAFTATTLPGVRPRPGFRVDVDGWLQGTAYVAVALLAALRPALCRVDRLLWTLVAVGLALRAGAFVFLFAYLRPRHEFPVPSLSDAGWLGMCLALTAALVLLVRQRFRSLTGAVLLDALTAGLTVGAVGVACLAGSISQVAAQDDRAAIVTGLLYPAFDGVLLLLVLGLVVAFGWAPPPGLWLFGAAVAGFAVLDGAYLYVTVHAGFLPGSPLAGLSLVSTALVALSAWAPPSRRPDRADPLPSVVVPVLLQATCVVVLLVATQREVPTAATVLAALALLVSFSRLAHSCRVVLSLIRSRTPAPPAYDDGELRTALSSAELELHYQPQVRLTDGAVVGMEALVRWRHPRWGLLAPGEFLGAMEAAGLSHELTQTVLQQALKQQCLWAADGHPVPVSVNVTARDLLEHDLVGLVRRTLERYRLPGSALQLELTEEAFVRAADAAEEVIVRLAALGVGVQVDDYGTGYSSLGYLRDLPQLAGLKLDRSFVVGLEDDPRAIAIVSSTIQLARYLSVELVAEGIETERVRDRLAVLGCTVAQGYLFGRPVPADQVSFAPVAAAVVVGV